MSDHESEHLPQLRMLRPSLLGLPPLDLPAGCVLRRYRPGDEAELTEVLREAFNEPSMAAQWAILDGYGFMPQRSWLIERDGRIVASASMLLSPDSPAARRSGTAFLHWVAARPARAGERLGYWVCMAVLHRMASEGYRQAGLGTDDGRFPAIKTYLNLGFEPRLIDDSHRGRWRKIFENLGMADEAELRFTHLLTGPLYGF